MPFASPEAPSIALTQLRSVVDEKFGGRVNVELHYLNLEFIEFVGGLEGYERMISGHGRLAGVADWLFRQIAFPEDTDNVDEYLARFFFDENDDEVRQTREFILDARPRLEGFLDELIDKHRLDQAVIVGFTSLFYQTVASFALAQRIKERNAEVVTVIGGAGCESEMGLEMARQVEAIDYVFSGPALVGFPEFVAKQLAGDRGGCSRIDGVFCRENFDAAGNGGVATLGEERDINQVAALDYDGFLDDFERHVPRMEFAPMLLFETARGCSWGEKIACTFCGLNGLTMDYRSMSPANALEQIRGMFRYVPRCTFFLAVDTIVPKAYLEEVFPELETPRSVAMMYEVRPLLGAEQLRTLADAGVLVIQPGIESLCTKTLGLMRKGTTAFGNLRFLKACQPLPLHIEWNLLLGSPGEPDDVSDRYLDLIPRLAHLHAPGAAYPISFDRFSQYFKQPDEHGLKLQPQEFYSFVYPFAPEAVANLAYHFVDGSGDHDGLNSRLDELNGAIGRWRERWKGKDGGVAARLRVERKSGGAVLFDSRSGEAIEVALGPVALELLGHLESPRLLDAIDERYAEDLGRLRELGALFEEGGRVLSLVTG